MQGQSGVLGRLVHSCVVGTVATASIITGCGSDEPAASGTGGQANGGTSASGGASGGSGGAGPSTGGVASTGGASGGAPANSGGSAPSGGAPANSGGSAPSGGAPANSGGSAQTGGSGGSAQSGGAPSSGGSPGSGGASTGGNASVLTVVPLPAPAVGRGGSYRGFAEKFNRYYTDAAWQPTKTIYVSPTGGGNGQTKAAPTTVAAGLSAATPGTRVYFVSGTYSGCYELGSERSGTYDAPVVLYGERTGAGARSVLINCCATGRQTCINVEAADYVAVDGFELSGGNYGVRAVGADYAASQHQKGVAVLDCEGHGQSRDPFFTGQSDWYVIERSLGRDAGSGDGHGIYLSNGSDWNIARFNELRNNYSSDLQINADPASTCTDVNIDVSSPDCDALAGTPGDGGRGASDFMLVEGNFFHDGLAQGPNFTSVRHSIVRNNVFAKYARHGVSFWQETTNPKLGSSDNQILHNLFVATVANRQMVQFVENSTRNRVENNVFVGVGGTRLAMEVDGTVTENQYVKNAYIAASLSGRTAAAGELTIPSFDQGIFAAFPAGASNDPAAWKPSATAPFLAQGALSPNVTFDRDGAARTAPTDLGPYER